jgi:hypothetical protein
MANQPNFTITVLEDLTAPSYADPIFAAPLIPTGTSTAAGAFFINKTNGIYQQRDYVTKWRGPAGTANTAGLIMGDNGVYYRGSDTFARTFPSSMGYSGVDPTVGPISYQIGSSADPNSSISNPAIADGYFGGSPFIYMTDKGVTAPPTTVTKYPQDLCALGQLMTANGASEARYIPYPKDGNYSRGFALTRSTTPQDTTLLYRSDSAYEQQVGADPTLDPTYVGLSTGPDSLSPTSDGRFCSTSRVGLGPYNYSARSLAVFGFGQRTPGYPEILFNPTDYPMCLDGYRVPDRSLNVNQTWIRENDLKPFSTKQYPVGFPKEYHGFLAQRTSAVDPKSGPVDDASSAVSWEPVTDGQKCRGVVSGPAMASAYRSTNYVASILSSISTKTIGDQTLRARTFRNTPGYLFTAATNINFATAADLNFINHHSGYPLREMGVMLYNRIGCDKQKSISEPESIAGSGAIGATVKTNFKTLDGDASYDNQSSFRAVEVMSNSVFVPLANSSLIDFKFNGRHLWSTTAPDYSKSRASFLNPYALVADQDVADADSPSIRMASALFCAQKSTADEIFPPAAVFLHAAGNVRDYLQTEDQIYIKNNMAKDPFDKLYGQDDFFKLPITTSRDYSATSSLFIEYQIGSMYIPPHLGLLFLDSEGGLLGPTKRFAGFSTLDLSNSANFFKSEDAPAKDGAFPVLDHLMLTQLLSYRDETGTLRKTFDVRYCTGVYVFERNDADFLSRFGLLANSSKSYSPQANLFEPARNSIAPDQNVARFQSRALDYFCDSISLKPVSLFPRSLLDTGPIPLPNPYPEASRRLSKKWLIMLIVFANYGRGKVGALFPTDNLLRLARLFPEPYPSDKKNGTDAYSIQTSADHLMSHYTMAWMSFYYSSKTKVSFDRYCQCIQYYPNFTAAALNCIPGHQSGPASAGINKYKCAMNAGGGNAGYLCVDDYCSKDPPDPYLPAASIVDKTGAANPCFERSIDINVSRTFCISLDILRQQGNSTVINSEAANNLCKESFSCRDDSSLYLPIAYPKYTIAYLEGQGAFSFITFPLYALAVELESNGIKSDPPQLSDLCGKPVSIFVGTNGAPLVPSSVGLVASFNLGFCVGGWFKFARYIETDATLSQVSASPYYNVSSMVQWGGCGASKGVSELVFAKITTNKAPETLVDLVGCKIYSADGGRMKELANGTTISDLNYSAVYQGVLGATTSCASPLTRYSASFSTISCDDEGLPTVVYSASPTFCDSTIFYSDAIKTPLRLSSPGYLTLAGNSAKVDSAGSVQGGCVVCTVAPTPTDISRQFGANINISVVLLTILLILIIIVTIIVILVAKKKRSVLVGKSTESNLASGIDVGYTGKGFEAE